MAQSPLVFTDCGTIMELQNLILLFAEAVFYFSVLLWLLHIRHRIGVGVLLTVLGVSHFLETYLAAKFYVPTPFGMMSPGSVMLYSGKLIMILMLYVREDATTVRQLIYGLLAGNSICLAFAYILSFHIVPGAAPGMGVDNDFLGQMGILMVWGTTLLYIESIGIILFYEWLGRRMARLVPLKMLLAGLVMLCFDQVCFYGALSYLYNAPLAVFWAGLCGKAMMAVIYCAIAGLYLRFFDGIQKAPRIVSDIFADLTYRERYNALLARTGLDALTGVMNRDRLQELGASVLRDTLRENRNVSLIVADVDHFKCVNDVHGHLEGDDVLRQIADVLKDALRDDDLLFRFGGEEFIVLMPNTGHADALDVGERLRADVEKKVKVAGSNAITVSFGVATAPVHGRTLVDLISCADKALYRAKAAGRNRVVGHNATA